MTCNPESLLPHRPPMVMIDSLLECGETSGTAVKTFSADSYGADGKAVSEPVLVECLAQTVAAMQGRQARDRGTSPAGGMLVGISDFRFHRPARLNEPLTLAVGVVRQLGSMLLAVGRVSQGGSLVAEGTLKFYVGTAPDGE